MRTLALDYGSQRIGLALSDPTGTLARPLPFLPATSDPKLARAVKALAEKEKVQLILLGLPRHMNGSLGDAFAAIPRHTPSIPLQLVDERLSTVQASRQLQEAGRNTRAQRERIDSEAAAVLLQSHLDTQSNLPSEEA